MRLLVTGITGFVGRHALAFVRAEHPAVEVLGLARHGDDVGCECLPADVEDAAALAAAVARARPERVLHLAAQSSPRDSFDDPAGTLRTNVFGTLHLLEAVKRHAPQARVLVVGSGEEYGTAGNDGRPLREDAPVRPLSPYAASKLAQSYLALQYHVGFGLDVLRTRTFNHSGPGRGAAFAESSFARQIAELEQAGGGMLAVGNLDTLRDFCDVRDVVRAYWALFEHGRAGEVYNVCSGTGVPIAEVLRRLVAQSSAAIEVRPDPARFRPADIAALVGDPSKLHAETGWRPTLSLDVTLRGLLADWRERVAAAHARR